MMNRRRFAAVVVAAGVLGVPATASATVTIGSTDPAVVPHPIAGQAYRTIVQSSGGNYVVPAGNWVVKSVAARLESGQFGVASVRFARPQNGKLLFLNQQGLELSQTTQPTVFTVNAPGQTQVRGGDLIGLTYGNDVTAYSDNTAGFTWQTIDENVNDNVEYELTAGAPDGPWAVSATLEPDADNDGYGDETQDTCPLDAERKEAPCATDLKVTQAVSATTIPSGGQLVSTFVISNLGPAKAVNVRLQSSYGQYLYHKAWPGFCENLTGQTFCNVGDIEPGQTVIVQGTVGAVEVKGNVSEARGGFVVSDNRELDKTNNTAADFLINVVAGAGGGGGGGGGGVTPGTVCKAPKLKGKTLSQAKKLIKTAHCALGKVTKPRKKLKKGYQLVVSKQKPAAGATAVVGTKIALTLKAVKKKRK